MEVRSLQVRVDRYHAVTGASNRDGQVCDEEGLADAALAATD